MEFAPKPPVTQVPFELINVFVLINNCNSIITVSMRLFAWWGSDRRLSVCVRRSSPDHHLPYRSTHGHVSNPCTWARHHMYFTNTVQHLFRQRRLYS